MSPQKYEIPSYDMLIYKGFMVKKFQYPGSLLFIVTLISVISCQREPIKIAIQPFNGVNKLYVASAKSAIEDHFDAEVIVLAYRPLPANCWYEPRNRYRADSLIHFLKSQKPDSITKIIGLTNQDISTTKGKYVDWGILGLGFRPGLSCVVSVFRLKRGTSNTEVIKGRMRKVVIHELGHTMGRKHCPEEKCVMQDAKGKLQTVEEANEAFCEKCQGKLGAWLKIGILEIRKQESGYFE